MAFLMYPGFFLVRVMLRFFDASTGEEYTDAFAEYELKLGVLVGGVAGKVRVAKTKFGIAMPTQDQCDDAAYAAALAR